MTQTDSQRRWRDKNREKARANWRNWYHRNHDEARRRVEFQRAHPKVVPEEEITPRVAKLLAIFERPHHAEAGR